MSQDLHGQHFSFRRPCSECGFYCRSIEQTFPDQHAIQEQLAYEIEIAQQKLAVKSGSSIFPLTLQDLLRDLAHERMASQAAVAPAFGVDVNRNAQEQLHGGLRVQRRNELGFGLRSVDDVVELRCAHEQAEATDDVPRHVSKLTEPRMRIALGQREVIAQLRAH